jgi:hypothetical protein
VPGSAPDQGWNRAKVVTPSDTVDLTDSANQPVIAQALYVGGAGNVVFVMPDGVTVLVTAPPVGSILPIKFKRINATNTTATLLVALWDN